MTTGLARAMWESMGNMARCPVCNRPYAVRADRRMRQHNVRQWRRDRLVFVRCRGSGGPDRPRPLREKARKP